MSNKDIMCFQAEICQERYYNENSCWGVYTFKTQDEIKYFNGNPKEYISDEGKSTYYYSVLCGEMQQLFGGCIYSVEATPVYNKKYNCWQYQPLSVKEINQCSEKNQYNFLVSILSEKQADSLLSVYPDIVQRVMKNKDVDINKIKGIDDDKWQLCKQKIINNYSMKDILALLSPYGISNTICQKLISLESQPELLKQKIFKNPYVITKVKGLGFKRADRVALKIRPDLKNSLERVTAFLKYYFSVLGEESGDTYIDFQKLREDVIDNIPECINEFDDFITSQRQSKNFLWIDNNNVGLRKYYDKEMAVLETIVNLDNGTVMNIDESYVDKVIRDAELSQGFEFDATQLDVIRGSLNKPVVLITGKAGTGKTSITRALLDIYTYNNMEIRCCALSAKAAQRITEATGYKASTIHRLLKYQQDSDSSIEEQFKYNSHNPLPIDVLFIDEFSMINVPLALSILSAVKQGTRVIICGDNRQLPPIGYGNVFNDLLGFSNKFTIYKLHKVHRQAEKSGILTNANKIRDGIDPIPRKEMRMVVGDNKDLIYQFRTNREGLRDIGIKSYLNAVNKFGIDNVVIITPRKSDCINSTAEINQIIQNNLLPNAPSVKTINGILKVGAKVIQRVNNYDKDIFNGEIGYVTSITHIKQDKTKKQGKSICVSVEYNNLLDENLKKTVNYIDSEVNEVQLAYALTVHLSQGSGYDCVIVIIDNTDYILLDNCLLYTALTRAKKKCMLLAEPSAYKQALRKNHSLSRKTWLNLLTN